MLTKNQYSLIRSLKQKKFRSELQLFVAEGAKLILDLLENKQFELHSIYANPSGVDKLGTKISKKIDIQAISDSDMTKISFLNSPSDSFAIFKMPVKVDKLNVDEPILMLDGLQDPGNLGTIIRTANWFGFRQVICSMNCVDLYNPKVVQATMGSLGKVEVYYDDLETFLKNNRTTVYGTLLNGESIYKKKFEKNGIFIFGSEGQGISKELMPYINAPITIPKFGDSESLNVAIAFGIVCSEIKR